MNRELLTSSSLHGAKKIFFVYVDALSQNRSSQPVELVASLRETIDNEGFLLDRSAADRGREGFLAPFGEHQTREPCCAVQHCTWPLL